MQKKGSVVRFIHVIGVSKFSQDFLKNGIFWKCLYKYFTKIPVECIFAACKKKLSYLLKYNFTPMKIFYTKQKSALSFSGHIKRGYILSKIQHTKKESPEKGI